MNIEETFTNTVTEERREEALKLFENMRGQYIIGQALAVAIWNMEQVEEGRREESNIADMRLLMEGLFPMGIFLSATMSVAQMGGIKSAFVEQLEGGKDA